MLGVGLVVWIQYEFLNSTLPSLFGFSQVHTNLVQAAMRIIRHKAQVITTVQMVRERCQISFESTNGL